MDYTRTPNLADCEGGGCECCARPNNRFPTSPLSAPNSCCIFRDEPITSIEIICTSLACDQITDRHDRTMILFFAQIPDYYLSKLRQKQTPGDHKLAGTSPQRFAGADHGTISDNSAWFQIQMKTSSHELAHHWSGRVLYKTCLTDLHLLYLSSRSASSELSVKQLIRTDPAFKYSHSLLL